MEQVLLMIALVERRKKSLIADPIDFRGAA
jgi:hypothetical protein